MSQFLYPIDMTGTAATNKVTGERHTLNPPVETRDYHFLLTRSGPFYRDTLVLTHETSGRLLVENLDWVPGHAFESASYETEYAMGGIFQSIVFLDRGLSGTILLDEYQVLGGEWSLDENKILEILSNRLHDPRSYSYEMVSGKPDTFPTIRHQHPGDDLVGQRQLVESVALISGRLNEQLTSLPPFLQNLLLNYYPKSTLDQMLVDLSTNIITTITGPEIETIIFEQLDGILAKYVLTTVFNGIIQGITQDVAALTHTSGISVGKINTIEQSILLLETGLLSRVSFQGMQQYVDTRLSNIIDMDDLVDFKTEINQRLSDYENSIAAAMAPIQNLLNVLDQYVRKDELIALLPDETIPDMGVTPIEVKTADLITGEVTGIYPFTVISHFVNQDGHIKTITVKSGDDQTLYVNIPSGTSYRDATEINVIGSQHTWDFKANWAADGYASDEEAYAGRKLNITPHSAVQYGLYLTIDWTVQLPNGSYNSNLRLDKIENSGIPVKNKIILTTSLRPKPTTHDDLLIGIIGVTPEGGLSVKNMVNKAGAQILETRSRVLTKAEMLTMDQVTIDFIDNLGHDANAQILGVKFYDPNGILMGVSGYYHDYFPCVINQVSVLKPSIDMSSFDVSDTALIEVTVATKTLR